MAKIPPDIVAGLLGFFMAAQARGWIDVKALEPLLRTAVDRGYGDNINRMLSEIGDLLYQIEHGIVRPVR